VIDGSGRGGILGTGGRSPANRFGEGAMVLQRIRRWFVRGARQDAGMTTVEYAVGTVVAAALAAVLYKIVTGDSVVSGLTHLVTTALSAIS
jgi:hypothetical protein